MLKKRVIPVLYLKNGLLVRSQQFRNFSELGNPINQLERLNNWQADELIYIDITRDGEHNLGRVDHKIRNQSSILNTLHEISKCCFMPLTFGGRINTFKQAVDFVSGGADKVIINTGAYRNPKLITQIAEYYGSQCVVIGIDVKRIDGKLYLVIDQGRELIVADSPEIWAKKVVDLGAGEIFVNSIDRDGMANGFDIEAVNLITSAVRVPVVACGGGGSFKDFIEVFQKTEASAVAAGNIFNFTENAYIRSKKALLLAGCCIKPNNVIEKSF